MRVLITLLLSLISSQVFATAQFADILIYNRDTLILHSNPLESYFDQKGNRKIGEVEMIGTCTALWRGYVATWELTNDSLFLVKVQTNCCSDPITLNIEQEFGTNRIFADWVSYPLLNPYGKMILYVHMRYHSVYEHERYFDFEGGKLKAVEEFKPSYVSILEKEPDSLNNFLYQVINWGLVKKFKLKKKARVMTWVWIDESGDIQDIQILGGINEELNKEARRVIRLIPEWSIYYKCGKVTIQPRRIPIYFDKKIYTKKKKKFQ